MSVGDWRSLPRKPRPDLAERNRKNAKHGLSGSPTQKSWEAMNRRCFNVSDKDYPDYGGRGITACARWRNSFVNFVADMGVKPAGTSLGRINNNGNYEPGNCRWETVFEQNNNRRSSRSVTAHGKTLTVAQWARELGVSRQVIRHRLENGWPPEVAVSQPAHKGNRYGSNNN